MIIEYLYDNKTIEFSIKDIENSIVMIATFKKSLKKNLGIDIIYFLSKSGYNIDLCRICKKEYPPIKINYKILKISDNRYRFYLTGFEYTRKIYCYGSNNKCPGISMNPNSFEFISLTLDISLDEAKKYIKSNNKSPFYRENWDSDKDYQKSQSRSLEYYLNKYGDELGNIKYNQHINKISFENTLDGYIKKYGSDGKYIFENVSKRKDSTSFNHFLLKNGNNYHLAKIEYDLRLKDVNCSIESLIKKHGIELGMKKHLNRVESIKNYRLSLSEEELLKYNKSMGITIDNLYKKYGCYEVARNKYNNWLEKIVVPLGIASKESLKVFLPLIDKLVVEFKIDPNDIYLGYKDRKEYFIKEDDNFFLYDFTICSKKIIIEYNGIIYHPKNEMSEWKNPFDKNITSEIAYNKQLFKVNTARNKGFKVLEIWSDDENNLEKCLDFIKNNI